MWAAYSPVKNSPADAAAKAAAGNPSHSGTSGELDWYQTNCKVVPPRGGGLDPGEGTRTLHLFGWRRAEGGWPHAHALASPTTTRNPTLLDTQMLEALGARVDGPRPAEFNGIAGLELWPRVTWSPLWAACWDDLAAKARPC